MPMPEQNLLTEARDIVASARKALGPDLAGFSLTDLLLDNMPALRNTAEARLLIAIGDLANPNAAIFKDGPNASN